MPWWKDRNLWVAMLVAVLLRTVPLAVWGQDWGCVRDECTYLKLARRMVEGQGMTTSAGWLWAPGYPFLLAIHRALTGYGATIKGMQVVAALLNVGLIYGLAARASGLWSDDQRLRRRSARIAAWLYALSLPQAFFAMSLWSEVLYSTLLLVALSALQATAPPSDDAVPRDLRADPAQRSGAHALGLALILGATVGLCVLFRGVATYMLPIFAVGILWRRWTRWRAWAQALAAVLAAVLVVAPYSIHISKKFDAVVISDRTLGQMMWLGDNDFAPLTFDYGNGQLSRYAYVRTKKKGRAACAPRKDAMVRDQCEVAAGLAWIKAHPAEFVERMPLRVAQLLNPHSLLTRHLRWGFWRGLPQWVDELIIAVGALEAMLTIWVGALGLAARGRRSLGLVVTGILLYHLAAIAMLAGLTRYRVPLEPLLMIYAAPVLAAPRQTLAALGFRRWRLAAAVLALGALVPLVLWFLPAGWPGWRTW
ncbi:MAG: hypothetical protein GXP62_05115 [Oligoflexia bacterium]|nr:hypothetical protein [Oligoflexia bacterium]